MNIRLYLDNCCFNRPYDDQALLRNRLESEAKTHIQMEILNGRFEMAWSYMMDYEISFNPFSERKIQISKWKRIAKTDIAESAEVLAAAREIAKKNVKPKDALHLACAMEAQCDYFITTDRKLLNKSFDPVVVIDPMNFIRIMEAQE